jgi:phospholipase C
VAKESLRGENDFFEDIAAGKLPPDGGIIYVRGGFQNIQQLHVPIQNPDFPVKLTSSDIYNIRGVKNGDDDHPAYADRQISEAMNARVINAIAANPQLWAESAIIITYDESDGYYDHVAPRILSYGPDGLPLSRGIRVPLLVISPYARAHVTSHAEGDHNAVIETIEDVFGLQPLASLPDEKAALEAGDSPAFNQFGPAGFHQKYLGPRDINSPITDSLLSAFDPARLSGAAPILPGAYAAIPDDVVETLPHYGGHGCQAIGMTPEDVLQGITTTVPPGFNSMPSTLPYYNGPGSLPYGS